MRHLKPLRELWCEAESRLRLRALEAAPAERRAPAQGLAPHLILLPPHPKDPLGSRGDQAMLMATVSQFLLANPGSQVSMICEPDTREQARTLGATPLPLWGRFALSSAQLNTLEQATHFAAVGADVMDGYYWPPHVLRMLQIINHAARLGLRTALLGFSFNAHPDPRCVTAFTHVLPEVDLLLREPVSKRRFERSTGMPARLVADAAFCLTPRTSPAIEPSLRWAQEQRARGREVLGFNLHKLLLGHGGVQPDEAISAAAEALSELMSSRQVAVLCLPHDYRGTLNDQQLLSEIAQRLPAATRDRVHVPEGVLWADELKALTGACDLVLTGRMHLAIAALGMGVPIAGITYQEKFEGLMEHFDLNQGLLLASNQIGDARALSAWMFSAVDQVAPARRQVRLRLPEVLALSQKNFSWMRPEQTSSTPDTTRADSHEDNSKNQRAAPC